MSKELKALKSIKGTIISSSRGDWGFEYRYVSDIESIKKDFDIIEVALNELEDSKHNYNALKEFYNNAVAYGAKIQKELNELKKRNEPMKPIILIELEQVRPFPQTYKTAMCGNCKNELSYIDKPRYCPDCGQKLDWSDEK